MYFLRRIVTDLQKNFEHNYLRQATVQLATIDQWYVSYRYFMKAGITVTHNVTSQAYLLHVQTDILDH